MSGDAELRKMIAFCQGLPGLIERTAPACAESFDKAVRDELDAGRSPDGASWVPKKDGGRPLAGAPDAIVTKAVGDTIVTAITGGEKWFYRFHNAGTKKLPSRPVVPSELTPKLADAIRAPLVEAFEREAPRG